MFKNLYIDVCLNYCMFIIFNNENDKEIIYQKTKNNVVDICVNLLNDFLIKNNTKYSDIDNIYLNQGPGTFTGVRVGINIAKTIKTIYKNIKIFTINSTQLLNCFNGIGAIDAKSNKWFVSAYDNNKLIIDLCCISNNELIDIKNKYPNLKLINDLELNEQKITQHFFKIINYFKYEEDWLNLVPLYVKDPI